MYRCPQCQGVLEQARSYVGVYWSCPAGHGRVATVELLGKLLPRPIVQAIWRDARDGEFVGDRPCVSCSRPMAAIPIMDGQRTVLDVCASCRFVWFDAGEYESLPELPEATPDHAYYTAEQKEAVARAELEMLKQRMRAEELEERRGRLGYRRYGRGSAMGMLLRLMWRL